MEIALSTYPNNIEKLRSDVLRIKGVAEAEFFEQKRALHFNIEPKYEEDAAEIIQSIVFLIRENKGEVLTEKLSLPVLNMTCAACASSSQNILGFVAGVLSASVNYGNGKGAVEYLPDIASPQQMKVALQEVGYDLLIEQTDDSAQTIENIEQQNYQKLRRQTFWAAVFAVPLIIIGMFFMHAPFANWTMLLLSSIILFGFGTRFFVGAWKQAKHRTANMDTLVALSTGIAYLFSVFNMFYPQFWERRGLEAHVYFEAAGVIIAFILLGKLLEARAKSNTSGAIKKLMGLQPSSVTVFRDQLPIEISIADVIVNDIVLVKPGDKIAVDGVVIEGASFVDESMISGEPIHVEKKQGEKVFAGTINQKGSFRFRATKVGHDTLLAHIIKTVDDAQGSKAPVQRLVDKIAAIFVPLVMGIALLSFIVWLIFGGENGFVYGLLSMVTVLVIACPCALGLATPTAIMVGIGKGAEEGILIKDAESLELAKQIDVVVLDKTGTITEGKPQVVAMHWLAEAQAIYKDILYSIEHQSEHPLADAIASELQSTANLLPHVSIEQVGGKGIEGKYKEVSYYIGNEQFILSKNCEISPELAAMVSAELSAARTIAIFADDSKAYAVISIFDKIKATSKEAINSLQKMNIEVAVYSGDNEKVVSALAKELGIAHFKGNVLPEEKVALVKLLQQQGKKVAMVGDGINDSGALAQADVSIAMGQGSDIAMDVAKMTIISSDLMKIPKATHLSRETVKTIRQNLFWAFIYNVIGIPIAAGLLYPINGFLLNPMIAGAAMALSSVSVVTNSLRLKPKKI